MVMLLPTLTAIRVTSQLELARFTLTRVREWVKQGLGDLIETGFIQEPTAPLNVRLIETTSGPTLQVSYKQVLLLEISVQLLCGHLRYQFKARSVAVRYDVDNPNSLETLLLILAETGVRCVYGTIKLDPVEDLAQLEYQATLEAKALQQRSSCMEMLTTLLTDYVCNVNDSITAGINTLLEEQADAELDAELDAKSGASLDSEAEAEKDFQAILQEFEELDYQSN